MMGYGFGNGNYGGYGPGYGMMSYGFGNGNYGSYGDIGPGYGMMGYGAGHCGALGAGYGGTNPITIEDAKAALTQYLATTGNADLKLTEVMEFDNHFYAEVEEKSTGIHAFELPGTSFYFKYVQILLVIR